VAAAVLATTGDWTPDELRLDQRGRREGFFCDDADVHAFLDEALTWRDLGYHWHRARHADAAGLETALPAWALATLGAHASDRRSHLYTRDELEGGATHDPLWNAAQRELVATGTIHNYLRMLWGKKVLEWSASPAEAYRTLEHLNNKYALDGRDPNSWTGILWCFGLFDRPWPPERPVFGSVRYMSSENTARKFDLEPYYAYVERLPEIAAVRAAG
jgi:deoxyribodipyrimidine photo-lyase